MTIDLDDLLDTHDDAWDRGRCAYFAYYHGWGPKAICSGGCRDEPSCITDEPNEGWPSTTRAWAVIDYLTGGWTR